jgi:hypothetical protein
MNYKLALVAAAALGVASTAQAADLAKKAPAAANYVKVCDAMGAGFFYIPGSDTCLKIGGYVRAEYRTGNQGVAANIGGLNTGDPRAKNGIWSRARFEVTFDARTATEMGLLRSLADIRIQQKSGAATEVVVEQAFVQFGGLTAGHATSFFDFVEGGYSFEILERATSDSRVNLLAYTYAFGNGISATLSLEDPTTADETSKGLGRRLGADYAGEKYPDVVANIAIAQAWGKAQLMGLLRSNYGTLKDKEGFIVGAGVEVNLPMIAAGDKAFLQATYGKGAVFTSSVNAWNDTTSGIGVDFVTDGNGAIKQTDHWAVAGGIHHEFTKIWEANLGASYLGVDGYQARDYNQYDVGGDVRWKPVANFYIGVSVDYRAVDFSKKTTVATGYEDSSAWIGSLRIQRNF